MEALSSKTAAHTVYFYASDPSMMTATVNGRQSEDAQTYRKQQKPKATILEDSLGN